MATQEERITALEQNFSLFKSETVRAYQELTVPYAVTKVLTENAIGRLADIKSTLSDHTARFERIESRLSSLENRLDSLETTMQAGFAQILARLPAQE